MSRFFERLKFRRWGKWIIATVVGGAAFSVISVEATSRSNFCNSCHIMEPYYTSWKQGSHRNVECVQCHISPGVDNFMAAKLNGLGQVVDDTLHRTSTKPSASVSQLSCLRGGCHVVENLNKPVSKNGIFKFNHEKHIGAKHLGVAISCGTCHSHVKGDNHFEVNTSTCITCHLIDGATTQTVKDSRRETKVIRLGIRDSHAISVASGEVSPPSACTTCHDPPKGEIKFQGLKFDHAQFLSFGATCESCHKGVTATPAPIDDARCLECHTFGVERSLEPREMHKIHTEGRHKIECASCHGSVRHGPEQQTVSIEQFDCTRCHIDQHNAQRQTYFNVDSSPHTAADNAPVSPMFMAHVDCTGCHTQKRALSFAPQTHASVMAASPKSCDACHQSGFGEMMIPRWQKDTKGLYAEVEKQVAEALAAGLTADELAEVTKRLSLVKVDGSWGVHNPRYTQQLLEQARTMLEAARAKRGKTQ